VMIIERMLLSMVSWLGLILVTFAVARATRLVTTDKITEPFRVAVAGRLREGSQLAYLVHCRWCVSVWVALLAAPPTCLAYGWSLWWSLPLALAFSQVTGLLASAERA
jgi:hypothetical protein